VCVAEKDFARKVAPTVLAAPSTTEIRLANENNAPFSNDAIVTNVDFLVEKGSINLVESGEAGPACAPTPANRSARPRASGRK
jgi:hypothetical protein